MQNGVAHETEQGTEGIRIEMSGNRVVATCGDEEIGRMTVPEVHFQWCANTFLPMGGIGGVGTKESYRKQGVAGRMMAQAVAYSKAQGYACGGVSTGAANVARRLYSRAGYRYVFSMQRFSSSPRRQAETPIPGTTIRAYQPGDEEAALALRNRIYGGFFGLRKPDASRWLARRRKTLEADAGSVLLAVQDGEPVGYASYFQHWIHTACDILVADCRDRMAAGSGLVRALESKLADLGYERAVFYATEDEPFVQALLKSEGYACDRDRAFHVHILCLDALLQQLAPSFEGRIRASRIPEWTGTLVMETPQGRGAIELGGEPGRSDLVLSASEAALTRVLCGRMSGWEAYLRGELHVRSERDAHTPALLRTLLPKTPCCHPIDEWW